MGQSLGTRKCGMSRVTIPWWLGGVVRLGCFAGVGVVAIDKLGERSVFVWWQISC